MTGKTIKLVHFPELLHQLRAGNTIAQFPACAMVHLAERETHKASFQQIRIPQNGLVWDAVEYNMLVYLIAEDNNVAVFYNGLQLFDVVHA